MYAFGFGICNGLTYMVPMHHGWLWFPDKPGLISGIIIGGFGFGALVFGPLATKIVNPHNELSVNGKYPEDVDEKVPFMLLILEVCYLFVCVISTLLIFPGPDPTEINEVFNRMEATIRTQSVIGETTSDSQFP